MSAVTIKIWFYRFFFGYGRSLHKEGINKLYQDKRKIILTNYTTNVILRKFEI